MLGPQAEADEPGDMLRFCIESRDIYPAFAAELADETGIDVELDRRGTLYLAFDGDELERLGRRVAWQTAAGLTAENLTAAETRRAEPFVSPDVAGGVLFSDDWQVENRKLCEALRRYARLNKVTVLENTRVEELLTDGGRITGVRTVHGEIPAGKTVIATGAWTSLIKLGDFPLPVSVTPVRGQMICYRTAKRLFERVLYSHGGYLVPRADGRILAGATSEDAGYVKANTSSGTTSLVEMAETISPALAGLDIADKWSGLRPRSADGLPVLGTITGLDYLYIATGHYRNGILLAPRTAEIMADLIVDGRRSECLDIFGPGRFRGSAARG
jgi:glycine oxidase